MDFYSKLEGMAGGLPPGMPFGKDIDPKTLLANMSDSQLQQLIEASP